MAVAVCVWLVDAGALAAESPAIASAIRIDGLGGQEVSVPRNILRIALLVATAGLLALAALKLREKKETVDLNTKQIEDTIAALDPVTRAAVIARLTADAEHQVKERAM